MSEENKKELYADLAMMVQEVNQRVKELKNFADENQLHFELSLGSANNVNRSIGGTYYGKGFEIDEDDRYQLVSEWYGSEAIDGDWDESSSYIGVLNKGAWAAWQSSSELC